MNIQTTALIRAWIQFDKPHFRIDLSEVVAECFTTYIITLVLKSGHHVHISHVEGSKTAPYVTVGSTTINVWTTKEDFESLPKTIEDHHRKMRISR